MGRKFVVLVVSVATLGLMCIAGSAPTVSAASRASATVTGQISGAPAGSKMLAVLSSGASSFARITGTKFSLKLPKTKGATATFSLHVVNAKQSYAGSISFGKKAGKKTTWFGKVAVKNGATTKMPRISFASTYGTVKMTGSAAKLALSSRLVGAASSGKPAGAGRLGLAPRSAKSKSVRATSVRAIPGQSSATGPGDDLDGDGIPNSLDIDDDGDGVADPVDQSAGANGKSPTAKYDAIGFLALSVGDGPDRQYSPINYNFMRSMFPNTADLMKEIALTNDANFAMDIRAVGPFFNPLLTTYIKAAWVDCTGLAWCLSGDDTTDAANVVYAPRIMSVGDGELEQIWQYAYTQTPGTPCDVHGGDCKQSNLWSEFSMKTFMQASKTNGNPRMTSTELAKVADQPSPGFGLYDPNIYKDPITSGSKNLEASGFDLGAEIKPRGGAKFLENLKPGDVFTINAAMSDGTTTSIAMTVAPFFVTAPAITVLTPAGRAPMPIDYSVPDTKCATRLDTSDCRPGADKNPITISAANPVLNLTFWRPQRVRIPVADDAIPGGEPFVDMGSLDYSVTLLGGGKSACPNSAVTFVSSDGSSWSAVSGGDESGKSQQFMHDNSPDSQALVSRTVSLRIDFSKCSGLSVVAGQTQYVLRVGAYSQPTFGGQRGGTMQTVLFTFG